MKTTCRSLTRGNPGARRGIRTIFITLILALLASQAIARPPARSSVRLIWNPVKQRVVLFGGSTPADSGGHRSYMNDMWEWDANRWTQVYAANPPQGRSGHALVWDSVQGRMLLFGGITGFDAQSVPILVNDTWALEGDSWQELNPATKPGARQSHGFAFDSARNRIIIYGGYNSSSEAIFDTWEFDGTIWTRIAESGPEIINPLMVYDPARNETIMLGSTNEETLADRKTEMYRRTATGWEKITLAADHFPTCTSFGGLIYEELYTRVVFQGGACQASSTLNETWVWHGTEWSQLAPKTSPGFPTGFGMANEPTRKQSVLFGGSDFSDRSSSYTFQGNQWSPSTDVWVPGARSLFGFQADNVTGRLILMGGVDDQRTTYNDMWSLRSGNWERMNPDPYPVSCYNPLTVWDKDRNTMVALCDDGGVAEWDTVKWTTFTLTTKPGSARFRNAVYDQKLKKTVLFGGYDEINYLRETWTWNGTAWTKLSKDAASPKPRCLTAMFYDPVSQRTIVFGGIGRPTSDDAVTRYADMWAFDGTKWSELKPATMPSVRYGPATGFNPETNTVVMFGGKSAEEAYLNEHWEWDGQNWKQLTPSPLPSPRMNGAMAVDPLSGKLTMYGGWSGYYQQEAWTWHGGKWELTPTSGGERQRPSRPRSGPTVTTPTATTTTHQLYTGNEN